MSDTPSPSTTPEAPVSPAPATEPAPAAPSRPAGGPLWGVGRRKTAVARVRLLPGSGILMVNKRDYKDYFKVDQQHAAVTDALRATNSEKRFDVHVNVRGGGPTGQSEAIRMGLARALIRADASLGPPLRERGYLTRDSRIVERKKYGRRKARRRFQFSKR